MSGKTVVRARIDSETKEQATKALAEMGLSVSDYIRMALVRVAHDKAVPFQVKVPNTLTAETFRKSERGEDVHTARDADDLFDQLGI
ncbi:MAG: type II toxin-antitoxin system RelB/DinJ family antitoxin [Wenzhouxiangellaceae bacterium]